MCSLVLVLSFTAAEKKQAWQYLAAFFVCQGIQIRAAAHPTSLQWLSATACSS